VGKPVVAIVAPGSMGAAVGARLSAHGVEVLTFLGDRSAASCERARTAGMTSVREQQLAEADFVLSIVPPAAALPFAERAASWLASVPRKPVFVDCNAVSPATVQRIAATVSATGAPFVDAGIIGGPPRTARTAGTAPRDARAGPPREAGVRSVAASGPNFYAAGSHAQRFESLAAYGLTIRVLEAPIGAASALKMSYAGITKGLTAVGVAMLLAAIRSGVDRALLGELSESQPQLLESFERGVPAMFPKAYRWVAEMREIAEFAAADSAAAQMFRGASSLYDRLSRDVAGERAESGALEIFLGIEKGR
jgi:L-threonate 2-dehydrogenase